MTWGAVNEWTTQTGYSQLSQRRPSGSFGAAEANHAPGRPAHRLLCQPGTRSPGRKRASAEACQVGTSQRFWEPVGSGVMPEDEMRFLADYLMTDEAGQEAARRIDRQIDRLPGLAGLDLVTTAVGNVLSAAA